MIQLSLRIDAPVMEDTKRRRVPSDLLRSLELIAYKISSGCTLLSMTCSSCAAKLECCVEYRVYFDRLLFGAAGGYCDPREVPGTVRLPAALRYNGPSGVKHAHMMSTPHSMAESVAHAGKFQGGALKSIVTLLNKRRMLTNVALWVGNWRNFVEGIGSGMPYRKARQKMAQRISRCPRWSFSVHKSGIGQIMMTACTKMLGTVVLISHWRRSTHCAGMVLSQAP